MSHAICMGYATALRLHDVDSHTCIIMDFALISDPCATTQCKEGYECDLDDNEKPTCICIRKCPDPERAIKVSPHQSIKVGPDYSP